MHLNHQVLHDCVVGPSLAVTLFDFNLSELFLILENYGSKIILMHLWWGGININGNVAPSTLAQQYTLRAHTLGQRAANGPHHDAPINRLQRAG